MKIVMSPYEKFNALGYAIRVSGPNRIELLNGMTRLRDETLHYNWQLNSSTTQSRI